MVPEARIERTTSGSKNGRILQDGALGDLLNEPQSYVCENTRYEAADEYNTLRVASYRQRP